MFGQSSSNTKKPVCQFYQKGVCKYGNKCWNLHPGTSAGNVFRGTSSPSVGFAGFGSNTIPQNEQFMEFVKQVSAEMNIWEKSGLWPLSCLAPLKEHPILAGLVDTSPEEFRVEAYEALKANNTAAYQACVNQKLSYQKQLHEAFKKQVPEAIEALKCVFYKTNSASSTSGASSSTSLFGKPSGPFSGNATATQPSLFGGSSSTTSAFGGAHNLSASSIFGSKTQNSAFGVAPVFGSSSTKGLDGGNAFKATAFGGQSSTSLFRGTSSTGTPAASGIFGGASQNQPTQGPLFGGSGSVFGSSSTGPQNKLATGLFGGVNGSQNTSSSLFGGSSSGSFGTSTSGFGTSSIFGSSQQSQQQTPSSVSGGTMPNPDTLNLFGVASQPSGNAQSSIFGSGMSGNVTNLFGGNQNQVGAGSGGIFGSSFGMNQQQTPSSLFGHVSKNSSSGAGSSTFGNSLFQMQTGGASNLFGSGTPNEQKSCSVTMTEAPSSSPTLILQTPNTSNSWFTSGPTTTSQSGSLFGGGQRINSMSSIFGTQPPQQTAVAQRLADSISPASQDVFGAPQAGGVAVTANTAGSSFLVSQMYTPLHLLTLQDKEEFEKEAFLRVPLVPPPRELCF